MNDEPRDREVESAYRAASGESPPRELDDRILAAAHRAVEAKPQAVPAKRGWIERYRIPLSLAATVVLATTITLLVRDESGRTIDGVPASEAPAVRRPEPAASATQPASPKEDRPRVAPKAAEAKRESSGAAHEVPARPAPAPEPPRALAAPVQSPPAPMAAPQSIDRAAGANASAPAPAAAREMQESLRGSAEAAKQAAPAAGAPMPRDRVLADRPERAERPDVTPMTSVARDTARTPEQWIADIRRLVAAGRDVEARVELEAFVRAHANYPLPADLKPLVP